MDERRHHIRVEVEISTKIESLEASGRCLEVLSKDISVSGLKVSHLLQIGDRFQIKLLFYGKGGALLTKGSVVWAKEFGSGLIFDDNSHENKRRLSGFIEKGLKKKPDGLVDRINGILSLLSEHNAYRGKSIIIDILKILYFKQKRLVKSNLKEKEIIRAIELVSFHCKNKFECLVKDRLTECFGNIEEGEALDYYEKNVMGEINDVFGRKIIIDEDGMRFLYKDKSGEHVVDPQNFQMNRAKRLPWIRFVLSCSEETYEVENYIGLTYLYVTKMTIPLKEKAYNSSTYFIIVVKKGKDKKFYFKTAYGVDKYNRFLKIIEEGRPFCL